MNKSLFFCVLVLSLAASAHAQTTSVRYYFDNFDTRDGVRIETPATAPAGKPLRKVRPMTRNVEAARPVAVPGGLPGSPPLPGAALSVGKSLDGFSTGDSAVDALIVESGTRHNLDPVLLYAIMHRESSFKKHAVSHKGARGLMQLMPGTATRFGVRNIFDPRQNIEGGARYMRFLLNLFDGDVGLALAGYNAGEGAVLKYGRRVPPYRETREYVRRITERYALMRDPQTARRAPVITRAQVAAIKASEKVAPLYEREVFAVRMPDGKLRLVSQ